jgi:hypothetical protein
VRQVDVHALIDQLAGTVLTHLSSLPARCALRGDLATRRSIGLVAFEVRTEITDVGIEMADKGGGAAAGSSGLTTGMARCA